MVLVHCSMMKDRTLCHNHTRQAGQQYPASAIGGPDDAAEFKETEDGALFKGRGVRYQTDADWRALKAVCQVVQWVHLAVWIPYWLGHGNGPARPLALVIMDGAAIALLLSVNVSRFVCYSCGKNNLFWIVRSKQDSQPGGYNSVSPHVDQKHAPFRLCAASFLYTTVRASPPLPSPLACDWFRLMMNATCR